MTPLAIFSISILVLSSHQRVSFPSGLFPSGSPTKTQHVFTLRVPNAPPNPSFIFDHPRIASHCRGYSMDVLAKSRMQKIEQSIRGVGNLI